MNISPILLLSIGSTFAILYGLVITIGWAITRKNRTKYHNAIGYSEVELFDLKHYEPMENRIKIVSLENNNFISQNDDKINFKKYDCHIVEIESPDYPKIQKGDLIFIDPSSNKIKYAFKIPQLKDFR